MSRIGTAVVLAVTVGCVLTQHFDTKAETQERRRRSSGQGATPDVDPQVYLVLTGGCWQHAETQGRYRLIVIEGGFEELFHIAYVELMGLDLERGLERVMQSTLISQTHDGENLVTLRNVQLARSEAQCSDAVFEGDIVRRTRERVISERRFRLQAHSDGNYVWSETAIPAPRSAAGGIGKGSPHPVTD